MRTQREINDQIELYENIIHEMVEDTRLKTVKLLIGQLKWVLEPPTYELCPECDGILADTGEVSDLWDGAFWCISCGKMYKIDKEED